MILNINGAALLTTIQDLVDVYNGVQKDSSEHFVLVNQGTGRMISTMKEETFNTMNLFVCVYDDKDLGINNQVGVFKGNKYAYNVPRRRACDSDEYHSGMIYEGLFINEIGIFHVKKDYRSHVGWAHKGSEINRVIVTCNMTKAVPFEEVRKALKNAKKIDTFDPGKATLSEIYEVLELAPQYLGLTQEQDKTHQKI